MDIVNKEKVHKLVMDMNEETELAFLEEIVKKRTERLDRNKFVKTPK